MAEVLANEVLVLALCLFLFFEINNIPAFVPKYKKTNQVN